VTVRVPVEASIFLIVPATVLPFLPLPFSALSSARPAPAQSPNATTAHTNRRNMGKLLVAPGNKWCKSRQRTGSNFSSRNEENVAYLTRAFTSHSRRED